MAGITPCLWFDDRVEEAVAYYTRIFPDSKVRDLRRTGPGGMAPEGSVLSATILLRGQALMLLNGGGPVAFTPAISFFVLCSDQAEVDRLWDALTEEGAPVRCGWLTDRYGVSWQIVPEALGRMLQDSDRAKAGRAMQAMLGMTRIDVAALERAVAEI